MIVTRKRERGWCAGWNKGRMWSPAWFALALAVATVLWTVTPFSWVAAGTEYQTLAGEDQYYTSVLLSRAGFEPGVDAVVVANGDDYRVAVSCAPLAAAYKGPVLLTPSGLLDWRVREEIKRLDPDRIFLVGVGTEVAKTIVSAFDYLSASGRVVMVSGSDVYHTIALVAQQIEQRSGETEGVVLIADDEASVAVADAVAASSLAAGKRWPVLFVSDDGDRPEGTALTLAGLEPGLAVEIGMSGEVGGETETVPLDGMNGSGLAAEIAEYAVTVGLGYSHIAVIDTQDPASMLGLGVGAYLGRDGGVVFAVEGDDLAAETIRLFREQVDEIGRVDFCGPVAAVCEDIQLLLEAVDLPTGFAAPRLMQGSEGEAVVWLQERLAELSYRPGPVDGVFDSRTQHAVIAFQKWEGLKRDGVVGTEVWWSLLAAKRPVPRVFDHGTWLEVDKTRQVLLYCVNNTVERTLDVSTGNPYIDGGIYTPSGVFHITRENTHERLRYKPLYLKPKGVLAIHGYGNVPTMPYSHGCIRMTRANMDELHDLIPVGTAVYIY